LDAARVLAKLNLIDKGSNYIFEDSCDTSVVKVAKAGLMDGENQLFRPDENVTREEAAQIAALLLENPWDGGDLPFTDASEISDWAKPRVAALFRDGIVTGYEDNTFRPREPLTYAELATLFVKIRDAYPLDAITANAANNAQVRDVRYLPLPEGCVGLLSVPSVGIHDLRVVEDGENLENIKTVAGHFVNTALFDGNVGICGHNFTDKPPYFGKLTDVRVGDEIVWRAKFGVRRYAVTSNQHIAAEDWSALTETDDDRITLVTCLLGQSQTTRILVQAVAVL
jgi:LPXTG-site transpeptidase (sortase) family protein